MITKALGKVPAFPMLNTHNVTFFSIANLDVRRQELCSQKSEQSAVRAGGAALGGVRGEAGRLPALGFSRKCPECPGRVAGTCTRGRGGRGGGKSACRGAHAGAWSALGGGRRSPAGRRAQLRRTASAVSGLGVLRGASANGKEEDPGGEKDGSAFRRLPLAAIRVGRRGWMTWIRERRGSSEEMGVCAPVSVCVGSSASTS